MAVSGKELFDERRDRVVTVVADHLVGNLFGGVDGVTHGNAATGPAQHLDIVVVVTEGHHIGGVQAERVDDVGDRL